MAKVIYTEIKDFKLFGKFNLFSLKTSYIEHSNDNNSSDDDFYIDLKERINRNNK